MRENNWTVLWSHIADFLEFGFEDVIKWGDTFAILKHTDKQSKTSMLYDITVNVTVYMNVETQLLDMYNRIYSIWKVFSQILCMHLRIIWS